MHVDNRNQNSRFL